MIESLRVFQQVTEAHSAARSGRRRSGRSSGRWPFQVEFFSGREFGLRVAREGIALLNRSKQLLE